MKLRSTPPAIIAILFTLVIILCGSCGGGGGSSTPQTYPNAAISISPQVVAIPVNGTQTFTATVTSDSYTPQWTVMGSATDSPVGTLTPQSGTGSTITYTAPAAPPLYGPIQSASGTVQGTVSIVAQVSTNPANFFDVVGTHVTFVITGPISVGLSPATASVHVGGTQQFTGYAVGSTNNALIWQVDGVAGGGTATGTITPTGLYTAPTALPMTGNTVTITAVSQADTTKSASSVVTLSAP